MLKMKKRFLKNHLISNGRHSVNFQIFQIKWGSWSHKFNTF